MECKYLTTLCGLSELFSFHFFRRSLHNLREYHPMHERSTTQQRLMVTTLYISRCLFCLTPSLLLNSASTYYICLFKHSFPFPQLILLDPEFPPLKTCARKLCLSLPCFHFLGITVLCCLVFENTLINIFCPVFIVYNGRASFGPC